MLGELGELRCCLRRRDAAAVDDLIARVGERAAMDLVSALRPEEQDDFLLLSPVRLHEATELIPRAERVRLVASINARRAAALARLARTIIRGI